MATIINDTCDVVFKRRSDGEIVFTAEAQLSSINQAVTEERILGGIGNKTLAILRSSKEIDLTVRNALWDSKWLEMANGTKFESETNTVIRKEDGLVVSGGGVTITGTPKTDGLIKVITSDGSQIEGTYATSKITFTGGEDGDIVTVIYEEEVTGQTMKILSDAFSEKYYVEYHTIEYDVDTNKIVKDLYWVFNSVVPSGNYSFSFENGAAITPELNFLVTTPVGSNEVGKVIEVDRVA